MFHQWRTRCLLFGIVFVLASYGCGTSAVTAEDTPLNRDSSPMTSETTTNVDPSAAGVNIAPSDRADPISPQTPSPAPIADGYYLLGGTDESLEVQGDQYRYSALDDIGGSSEWQPISQLTAIGEGLIFDGTTYWCSRSTAPSEGGICTVNGWQTYSTIGQLDPGELSLGGVEAGASEAAVIALLGQPDQVERTSPVSSQLIYRGLSVSFYEDAALTIRSVDASYCTPSGVCPGMEVVEVERIYGAPIVSDRTDGQYLEYYVNAVACWVELEVIGDEIGAIGIVCQI